MSRHTFQTDANGKPITVVMGYDRPLDYVFCTVENKDNVLYSNLDDENAGCDQQDVSYYRSILTELGIEVPETMFREVAKDQLRRVGNRVELHTKTGLAPS